MYFPCEPNISFQHGAEFSRQHPILAIFFISWGIGRASFGEPPKNVLGSQAKYIHVKGFQINPG